MADRIKGITIEIGGDTTGLNKALSGVNSEIRSTQSQLKDVERLLKLDPSNTELLKQKQHLLADAVGETKEKLETLKNAEKQAQKQFEEGKISKQQYEALKREIVATEQSLESLKKQADNSFVSLNKIGEAAGKVKGAGEKISAAGQGMSKLSAGIVAVGTTAGVMASDFEDAMAKVSTIADTTDVPIEKLKKQILNLSNESGIAASDIADNVYNAISAGQKTGDAVNFVSNATKLAKAGFTDSSSALDVLTTTLNAYGMEASEVTAVADKLITTQNLGKTTVGELASSMGKVIPTAKSQNVAIDDLCGAYAVMTSNGIATAETTTYMNSMLNELGKKGTAAATAFAKGTEHIKKGGMTMAEAMEQGWKLTDVLSILDEQAYDSGTSISNMFSSAEAGKAATVLWSNAEKLDDAVKAMGDSSGATETAFEKLNTTSNKLKVAFNEIKNAGIELGATIIETLMPVIEKVIEGVKKVSEWFGGLNESQKKTIVAIGMIVAAIGPMLLIIGKLVIFVGNVMTAISKLGPLITALKTAFTALTGPIGIAIAVIGALVAAFIYFWNTSEGFRAFWMGLWENIKAIAGQVVDALIEFFTVTIPQAWDNLVAFFKGIPEWWESLWGGIRDKFAEVWDSIMQNPVVQTIVQSITDRWDNFVTTITGIWENVKAIAAAAWELIKNVILGPVLLLIDLVTGNFDKLKTDAANIWTNIKTAALTIWTNLKEMLVKLVVGILTDMDLKFKAIRDTVVKIVLNLKDKAVDAFWKLVHGIGDKLVELPGIIEDGFRDAIEFITSLPGKALEWGKDFIQGLIDGIKSKISAIKEAVSEVGENIRSFLHFSRPDVGPLRKYEEWMPDMMEGLSKGIKENMWRVTDQIRALSVSMQVSPASGVDRMAANLTGVESLMGLILQSIDGLGGMTVVLDDGTLVGRMLPKIDRKLRQNEAYYLRGGAV